MSSSSVATTRRNGTNLFVGESEVSGGPSQIKGSNGLADVGAVGLDETDFPTGQWFSACFDSGKHPVNLFSMGDNEL